MMRIVLIIAAGLVAGAEDIDHSRLLHLEANVPNESVCDVEYRAVVGWDGFAMCLGYASYDPEASEFVAEIQFEWATEGPRWVLDSGDHLLVDLEFDGQVETYPVGIWYHDKFVRGENHHTNYNPISIPCDHKPDSVTIRYSRFTLGPLRVGDMP